VGWSWLSSLFADAARSGLESRLFSGATRNIQLTALECNAARFSVVVSYEKGGTMKGNFDGSPETRAIGIPMDSTFSYSDTRESPFPDEPADKYVCFLEIERVDGSLIVLAEIRGG
jgi:hypothetical protein